MSRRRWSYMADPRFNPPSDLCPSCTEASVVYFIGGKQTIRNNALKTVYTYECDRGHTWEKVEEL